MKIDHIQKITDKTREMIMQHDESEEFLTKEFENKIINSESVKRLVKRLIDDFKREGIIYAPKVDKLRRL